MAETKKTPIEAAKEKYDIAMKAANDALGKSPVDLVAYNATLAELDSAEKEYSNLSAIAMYDEYKGKNNPVVEIVKAYAYTTIGHKETKSSDGSRILSVDPTTKERQIDLLKFCKRANIDSDWEYSASRFNQLMCLRAAEALGCDVKQIAKTYFLQQKVKKIDMGGTPTSNTQVVKLLQRVIDAILPNENDEGKSIYKVNNYDVAYLDDLYGKKDNKNRLTVRVSNDAFFRRILVDICYRLVTDSKYGVNGFKTVKTETKPENK